MTVRVRQWSVAALLLSALLALGTGAVVAHEIKPGVEYALRETWAAVPPPKIVIAAGACALGGGPFAGADSCGGGVPADVPVDLWIPGCPPHPLTVLDGLLRLLGRLEEGRVDPGEPAPAGR